MPIAAVPTYLGKDFSQASPGLRFGMYLPLWGIDRRTKQLLWKTYDIDYEVRGQLRQEREVKNENKASALAQVGKLNANDRDTMKAIAARQAQLASISTHTLTLDAIATAPFSTGLGNEHPLENGFAFLNPYGLPYLSGSGVKGVLRQAARELASGEWGDTQGWSDTAITTLFGKETHDGDKEHLRGALHFWDALPQIPGDSLAVDIMTPHQSHYYQQKVDRKSGGSVSPHDSGQPNPISFLTLPPGTRFAFHVQCKLPHLQRQAPDLAENARWQALLSAAFEHAFEWLGFGAKTAVGYGAMAVDKRAQRQRAQAQQEAIQAAHRASLSPAQQRIEAFVAELRAKHEQFPTFKEGPNATFHSRARELAKAAHEGIDWSAEEKQAAALAIEEWLPKLVRVDIKDERKKLKLGALKGA